MIPPAGPRRNGAPIVLVGGLMVWGREELLGLKYWGGPGGDLQEDLRGAGCETVTCAPGPFSSNWDRAAEVYAQLRGGRVDYGAAHAARFGHARFGRAYPGLLPAWGSAAMPRIHLVGHSMGGQTIRVLAHLLAEGDEAERAATPPGELSPLFLGGQDAVLSLTTLSSPHDGTTLTRKREGIQDLIRRFLTVVHTLAPARALYDLKLDAWGLERRPREGWVSYQARVLASPLWLGTEDLCAAELSLEGAASLNARIRLPRGVHGFSLSTAKTLPGPGGTQVPDPAMNVLWKPGARFMGGPRGAQPGQIPADASWFRNDGVVNTRSMACPSTEPAESWDGVLRPGRWTHLGVLDGWDHTEILGHGPGRAAEALELYLDLAAFLGSLD